MRMRRRGGRGRSESNPRQFERLRDVRDFGLSGLQALERVPSMPARVEIGHGLAEGERQVALVAASRDAGDLAGWGLVASARAPERSREIWIAAPAFSAETRDSAARLVGRGFALRLVSVPALSTEDEVHVEERLPETIGSASASAGLLDRVLRVVDGAAALAGSGGVRSVPGGYVVYLRGRLLLRVSSGSEGVAVQVVAPERREIQVSEAGFARWSVELHECVTEAARDPRVLDDTIVERERIAEGAAAAAGVRIVSRWLPGDGDAADPIDWVGQSEVGPVLGCVRRVVGLAEVPALVAAAHRLEREPEAWNVAASGSPRLLLISDDIDPEARDLLQLAGLRLGVAPEAEAREASEGLSLPPRPERTERAERDRQGRRRSRRRRRGGRGEGRGPSESEEAPARAESRGDEEPVEPEVEAAEGPRALVPLSAFPGEDEPSADSEERSADSAAKETERAEGARAEEEGARAEEEGARAEEEPALRSRDDAAGEQAAEEPSTEEPEADSRDQVDEEIEATLAEDPDAAPEVSAPERPRRRNSRAAIVVANELDSILSALVLARERRSVVSFVVCEQQGLMDYFRTRATDVGENVDILLVGFTAQPIPSEIISTVELYRGRLDWFDHHDWPIEDLEMLRSAIGEDAIQIVEGASSPLAAIMEMTERRSRFTDKMVDLSARRLGENDMQKWGLRLVGLLERLAAQPGEHRQEIQPVLAGKPAELPEAEGVYAREEAWVGEHDPRLVYFGEYQMVVVDVPEGLDAGEVARRMRVKTGSRLSFSTRTGDDLVWIACNEEKRHVNVLGLAEQLGGRLSWAETRVGGDRTGRVFIQDLARHPERTEIALAEVVRNKSILYG